MVVLLLSQNGPLPVLERFLIVIGDEVWEAISVVKWAVVEIEIEILKGVVSAPQVLWAAFP